MVSLKHRVARSAGVLLAISLAISAQATLSDKSAVVASQGGQQLTLAEVDESVQRVPAENRARFIDSPQRIQTLLSSLLLQKQLAAFARSSGLASDPAVAAATGLAQVELLAAAQMKRFKDQVKVPDLNALALERYIGNKEKYVSPQVVQAQHILITTGARSDEEAKALAEDIASQVKRDPVQFDALVEKYSGDPDKAKTKGLIKDADNERYGPEFAKAIQGLERPGDISTVFKTGDGFHVLKLVMKVPARQKSFDEVREEILTQLSEEFVRKTIQNYVDGLRNNPMDANPDLVASLRTRYAGSNVSSTDAAAGSATSKP